MEATEVLKGQNTYEIAQKVQNGELLICNKAGRSKVWEIFAKIIQKDGNEVKDFVYCKGCGKVFCFNRTSTSNLVRHKCYTEKLLKRVEETSTTETEKPTNENVESSINNLTKLLTKWIIRNGQSYDLFQRESLKPVFQEFARLGSKFGSDIDVDSVLPSLSAVANNVSEIYEACFNRVKAEIALIKDNGFGLTTDIWTDNLTKQGYIALTIHYLKSGVLLSHLLGLKALEDEKSTNQNINETVKTILDDFDCKLSSKSILVTDGCGDCVKIAAVNQTLPCISQLISNALQKSVKRVPEVTEIISACSKLVNLLKKMKLGYLLGSSAQSYSHCRWKTTFKMLNSVESKWSDIEKTLENMQEKAQILALNINHLKALTKTFQPFEDAIESLEDDSYATLHLVIVYLHELKKSCDTNDSEFRDFDFIESLKENLRFNLEKIFDENITNIHKLALFLYPPTNKLLQFSDQDKKCVEDECLRLINCFKNELKPTIKQEPTCPPVSKRKKLFSDFVESETNSDPNEQFIQEIQYYKSTRVVNSSDFDVFGWWELQKDTFPHLYKLSCIILATPATSCLPKRIFSTARSMLTKKSEYGSPETEIEKIMFINSNAEHDELDSHFSD